MTTLEKPVIEFFFDFVCPYAYLASTQIERIAHEAGTSVVWKPMLLGGVFRAIGAPDTPRMPKAKAEMNQLDLARWSKKLGVPLETPKDHPRSTVLALRAAIASGDLVRATRALFRAYWAEGRDVSDAEVVRAALDSEGLDGTTSVMLAESPETKADLRRRTEEAVGLGIFGAPTSVVRSGRGVEIFWGQDRLDFVRHAVTGEAFSEPGTEAQPSFEGDATATELQFYFDFSSPFAYLASTQVRALAQRTRASLVYRPLLLGALFKAIGTPNVPLFEMSDAKRAYLGMELDRWAGRWRVPFKFSPVFPMNTVKALRLVLAAPEERRPDLVDVLFRAAWVEERDLSDDVVLSEALERANCPRELLQTMGTAPIKDLLREATSEAEARGLFGVPSFVLGAPGQPGALYWGQDRLGLVEDALMSPTRPADERTGAPLKT